MPTYNWTNEVSDCCGAAVTGTMKGIACKHCWQTVTPREPDPTLDALAARKHDALVEKFKLISGEK